MEGIPLRIAYEGNANYMHFASASWSSQELIKRGLRTYKKKKSCQWLPRDIMSINENILSKKEIRDCDDRNVSYFMIFTFMSSEKKQFYTPPLATASQQHMYLQLASQQ